MAQDRVKPGDLITADLINSILARLEALESRPAPPPTFTFPTFPTLATFPTFIATAIGPTFPTLATQLTRTFITGFSPNVGTTIKPEDTVRVIPGVGSAEEAALANAGISNIKALADADPVKLAETLKVQPQDAAGMVGIARGMLGPVR
jgi:hypothetical protein